MEFLSGTSHVGLKTYSIFPISNSLHLDLIDSSFRLFSDDRHMNHISTSIITANFAFGVMIEVVMVLSFHVYLYSLVMHR